MRIVIGDGGRNLCKETTKAVFNNVSDFESYWLNKNEEFVKKYSGIGTHEDAVEVTKSTVQKISSEFKDGDEIIHFDDHGVAPRQCEREYVLIKRDSEVIKSVLIRMS